MAVKCGVARLVLRSGWGEPEAQRCEQIVWNSQKPLVRSAVRQTAISVTSQCTKRNTLLSEERGVAAGFGEPHPVFV